jgi:hypothetical protein
VDPGETCDTAIVAGAPGACPPTCDDGFACTPDTRSGSGCTVVCTHDPDELITAVVLGDGCCPAGAMREKTGDTDCSPTCGNMILDPGETCDILIRGATGACPTTMDCQTAGCTQAILVSAGTCSAVCARYPIVTPSGTDSDNCCPPGATNAIDTDCEPACGNGVIDPSETCDVGIPPLLPGACPTTCDDGKSCTIDFFLTRGCQPACNHFEITTPISGDGCCPEGKGFTQAQDTDCPAVCNNGVVERGESCDPPSSCPTSCPVPVGKNTQKVGCLAAQIVGNAKNCTARCEVYEIAACDLEASDLCCPAGCTAVTDVDCSPFCGDGFVSTTFGEECDINGRTIDLTACPLSCSDGNPCTEDRLISAGTCAARCEHLPITAFRAGDGCCPPGVGANFTLDPDCPAVCGNRVVEPPGERCDYAVGFCPGPNCSCPGPETCPASAFCTRYVLQGYSCSAACVAMPITQCFAGDGCCPPGCTTANDTDCLPICGNGVVEGKESCDRGITAGHQGACPSTCDDGNRCTVDIASGSTEGCTRTCSNHPVTGCVAGDGCCPAGCAAVGDPDCSPTCGDNRVGAGETCDPPSTCPTACPDDGDPCTAEQLTGSAAGCNTACRHVPITTCSGSTGDNCCPTGCTKGNDWDCL